MLLNGRKIEEYVIVVPRYNLSYYVLREVNELNEFLYQKIGKKLSVLKDHEETTAPQIVVGECQIDGVETITEHTEYHIKSENGNVYINGGRNYSTARAVEVFTELLQNCDDVKVENIVGDTVDGKGSDGYRLVWNDDFETLDKDAWYIMNGDSGHYGWYGKCPFRSSSPENVFVKDSVVKGEYLAWFSKNITFINCTIVGTQPFCYVENLKLDVYIFVPRMTMKIFMAPI